MFEIIRKAMMAGFGAQEKVNEFLQDLVAKGELSQSQSAKLVKEWTASAEKTSDEINKTMSEAVGKAVARLNLATHEDMEGLSQRLQALQARVTRIEESLAVKKPGEPGASD